MNYVITLYILTDKDKHSAAAAAAAGRRGK